MSDCGLEEFREAPCMSPSAERIDAGWVVRMTAAKGLLPLLLARDGSLRRGNLHETSETTKG